MSETNLPIYVTKPYLPPIESVVRRLAGVWESKILTNGGPLHQELEEALCAYLGVQHLSLFANGTLALLIALKALRLQGEVITTPYSFVATTEAITWNGLVPVFADISSGGFNLDPESIRRCISPRSAAILAVHCYGYPCNVEAIQEIANDYNLAVIYDAAHAFGVQCHCGSLLQHGDLSVLSFHATKVFNTFEGGAIISPDAKTKARIDRLKNFGFVNEESVALSGINAKMSELNAAVGLAQLEVIDEAIHRRQLISEHYHSRLAGQAAFRIADFSSQQKSNFSYYPIVFAPNAHCSRDQAFDFLRQHQVYARKYFYPLITDFRMFESYPSADGLPNASRTARSVLCLPIYPDLSLADVDRICDLLIQCVAG